MKRATRMQQSPNTNDDPMRDFVQSFLKSHGLYADKIPETKEKTPDLKLSFAEERILIEVKCKEDDQQFRNIVNSPPETVHPYKKSTLETLLKTAWHQIRDFPERCDSDFTLVWLIAIEPGITVFVTPTVMNTLYGIENLEGQLDRNAGTYEKPCFFFGHSFFFRRNKLDGVVLQDDSRLSLCLNPFSKRQNDFRHTPITGLFRKKFKIIDPDEMEKANKCFVADCDLPRTDRNGVVCYLKKKYGLRTITRNRFVLMNCPAD